ncbi:MAG: hypothetical protein M1818_006847 [Claussenomyces sp. TS43310]|nr:MAG: hypothetical protein M1818_006847 [Claussenomyces sp. TS43310]
MCTGLLALCSCGHAQALRYTTVCPLGRCAAPTGRRQAVEYQCGGCDGRDQARLEHGITREAALDATARAAAADEAQARQQTDEERRRVQQLWFGGALTGRQRERRLRILDDEALAARGRRRARWEREVESIEMESERSGRELERSWDAKLDTRMLWRG